MTRRIPHPADPFEEEGLPATDAVLPGKAITGDEQDAMTPPAERPIGTDGYGVTAAEQRRGETISAYAAAEEPDTWTREDQAPDESMTADSPYPADPEERAGRLVDSDEGAHSDTEPDTVATDVGTDGGGFSAEERAIHVEPEA